MILSEAVFLRGSEVRRILEDLDTGRVRFKPAEENKRLAGRIWRNPARHDINYSSTIGTCYRNGDRVLAPSGDSLERGRGV